MHEQKLAYTVTEAAAQVGLSEAEVRARCAEGEFGFKAGKSQKWTIPHGQLAEWVEREAAKWNASISGGGQ